jgi:hypothetical protein
VKKESAAPRAPRGTEHGGMHACVCLYNTAVIPVGYNSAVILVGYRYNSAVFLLVTTLRCLLSAVTAVGLTSCAHCTARVPAPWPATKYPLHINALQTYYAASARILLTRIDGARRVWQWDSLTYA